MPPILDVDAVQTAMATSSRSPISRSLAARRQGGRGLMYVSDCNTLTTTSLMGTLSSPTTKMHCLHIFGSRCDHMGILPHATSRPAPVLQPVLKRHERQFGRSIFIAVGSPRLAHNTENKSEG